MEQDPDSGPPPDASLHHHHPQHLQHIQHIQHTQQHPDPNHPDHTSQQYNYAEPPTDIAPAPFLDTANGVQDASHTDTQLLAPVAAAPLDSLTSAITASPSASAADTADAVYHDLPLPAVPAASPAPLTAASAVSAAAHDALPVTPIDPDDFYKTCRLNPDVSSSSAAPATVMASTLSHQPALNNGNDIAMASHAAGPVAPPSRSPGPQPGTRVVSGPTVRPKGGPSVKDLKKRFDEKGAGASAAAISSRPAHTVPRQRRGLTESSIASRNGPTASSADNPSHKAQGSVDASQMPSLPQSLNSNQSFANRIHKSSSSPVPAAASLSQLSRKPHAQQRPGQASGLLFGEVAPEHHDSASAGFGIDAIRPRRTSESSVHSKPRLQSMSDPEQDLNLSSSVCSSYASAPTHPMPTASPRSAGQSPRTRSQSDASSRGSSNRTPIALGASTGSLGASHSASKLPVAVRRLNSPTSSSGDTSPARGPSPATLRHLASGSSHSSRITPPPSRAKTPTSTNKTPTPAVRERRPPPPSLSNSTNSNGRLRSQSITPPKLSPTLRSSRPRQPLTNTANIGSKTRDAGTKSSRSRAKDAQPRRRKISAGPIDFEQRREHIRLAYSKSIRETQALEARQKAEAQAKRAGQDAAKAMPNGQNNADIPPVPQIPPEAIQNSTAEIAKPTVPATEIEAPAATPLSISPAVANSVAAAADDSPTLGIPGSFPLSSPAMPQQPDKRASVASTASETTEFDGETQTTPPVPAQQHPEAPATVVKPPSPSQASAPRPRTEYQYPFRDEQDDIHQRAQEHAQFMVHHESPQLASASRQPSPIPAQTGAMGNSSASFPRIEMSEESDCQSEMDAGQGMHNNTYPRSEAATTDACTEDTDDHDRYDRTLDFRFGDQIDSKRASTCASSDVSGFDDLQPYSSDRGSYSVPGNLGIPSSRFRPDRASHQSAWTDLSVDSSGQADVAGSGMFVSTPNSGRLSNPFSSTTSPRQDSFPERSTAQTEKQLPATPGKHQLPELDTGEGFSIPYLSPEPSQSLSYLPSPPAHEPPPIPKSASGSALHSRNTSAIYEPSQSTSTLLNSERDSDAYMTYANTPRSVDTTSFETADNDSSSKVAGTDSDGKSLHQDGDAPSEKERHRLMQRRNVIKELVDTEAVFVRDMNIVEEIYKGTAEACPRLDDQTVKLIFRNSHEIIEFHTSFLAEIKSAVAPVYVPKGGRTAKTPQPPGTVDPASSKSSEISDSDDRETAIGPVFHRHLERMKIVHEGFLRNSDQAAKKLIQIQQDPTVQLWLTECNEVAKDLTAAWDLDSLLIKPMQRITKYPNLIMTLLQHSPQDHPDREPLATAKDSLETAIIDINKTKKNFELVGQIVGRKQKDSDVKAGFARAFGKRVDKLQASNSRSPDDSAYTKLNEKFGDDFVQLQVVLRDVEFYTRQVSQYVHEFLQYLSSIELVMRLQPGNFPEIESKWVQFNISMRDLEKVALEDHLAQVRKQVIEPFEQVIKAYGNPSLAMKKRQKRRLDYERADQQRRSGKSLDPKTRELVEQYDALNDALKAELPKLSAMTEKIGKICLGNFVNIQANWYKMWTGKMKTVLADSPDVPTIDDITTTFNRDFPYAAEQLASIGILNPDSNVRASNSTDYRQRFSEIERRGRGSSVNDESAPTLPTPDFGKRSSAGISMSPSAASSTSNVAAATNPHQYYYRDYYSGIQTYGTNSASPKSTDLAGSSRSITGTGHTSTRPSTGKSFDSGAVQRQSSDMASVQRSDSNTTYTSSHVQQENPRFSNLFHSALPLPDGTEESQRSSRASSRERGRGSDGYNILWLAASLFEFNIETTKHEAGYPYLTYQAGEVRARNVRSKLKSY